MSFFIKKNKPMTLLEKIKSMNKKELAQYLTDVEKYAFKSGSYKTIKEWTLDLDQYLLPEVYK